MNDGTARSPDWKWYVCGMMLLATMLNYMDRQTLSVTITDISRELQLTNTHYGNLELGFGLAFAVGGIVTGLLADRLSVRWLYPAVLAGWSLAGVATAFADKIGAAVSSLGIGDGLPDGYLGLMVCRTMLGFFEAGQWPCALVTSQRLLAPRDRPLGNSLLQSGAALGAIITPLIVQAMVSEAAAGSWRGPFQLIGTLGLLWIVPWLVIVRPGDLRQHDDAIMVDAAVECEPADDDEARHVGPRPNPAAFWRRFAALLVTVIAINLCFHFFRAWLPKFLREFHGYDRDTVNYFTSAYFIATDVGCLSMGLAVKRLTLRGWPVHGARMATFALCCVLTGLSTVAAVLPRGPALLAVLLVIGFGALGLFPSYYSLTQELSTRHQGKVTGALGCATWTCTALMQKYVGVTVDETQSYAAGIFLVGLLPLAALVALALLWNGRQRSPDNFQP
jgi:MFS transporter, ACS family, hexuronate transporter